MKKEREQRAGIDTWGQGKRNLNNEKRKNWQMRKQERAEQVGKRDRKSLGSSLSTKLRGAASCFKTVFFMRSGGFQWKHHLFQRRVYQEFYLEKAVSRSQILKWPLDLHIGKKKRSTYWKLLKGIKNQVKV